MRTWTAVKRPLHSWRKAAKRSAEKRVSTFLSWLSISLLLPLKCIIISLLCLTTTTLPTPPSGPVSLLCQGKLCCELSLCNICLSVIFLWAFFSIFIHFLNQQKDFFPPLFVVVVQVANNERAKKNIPASQPTRFFPLSIKLNLTMRYEPSVDATERWALEVNDMAELFRKSRQIVFINIDGCRVSARRFGLPGRASSSFSIKLCRFSPLWRSKVY